MRRGNDGPGSQRYRAVTALSLSLQPALRKLASMSINGAPAQGGTPLTQEAVMGQPIPAQHPSVVLRSHFNLVRTLLVLAMAALIASRRSRGDPRERRRTRTIRRPCASPHRRRSRSAPGGHALRRRPRRGHPRSRQPSGQLPVARASTAAPTRARAARLVLRLAPPAVQLSAGSGRWLQGSRRRPEHDPAGSAGH